MKVTCIQMDMQLGKVDENYAHAKSLIEKAMKDQPDVLVLPETWDIGFFPREELAVLCDQDGQRVKREIGLLAKQYNVNIVAGSVADCRDSKIYNTSYVFDRKGNCIACYDKTHSFAPMGEDNYFTKGDQLCRFTLDGVSCGILICYDIRFPELTRTLAVQGLDLMFVVSQWPNVRTFHLRSLTTARAIENQMFVCCCNSCGTAGQTVYGGNSAIINPWGETLALAGETEEILSAECDFSILQNIRSSINVFADRRPELYRI